MIIMNDEMYDVGLSESQPEDTCDLDSRKIGDCHCRTARGRSQIADTERAVPHASGGKFIAKSACICLAARQIVTACLVP